MDSMITEINDIIIEIETLSQPLNTKALSKIGLTKEAVEQTRQNLKNNALDKLKVKIKNYIEHMKTQIRMLYNVDIANLNTIINELETFRDGLKPESIKDLGKNFSGFVTRLNTELAAKKIESNNNMARELHNNLVQIDMAKRDLQIKIRYLEKYKDDKFFGNLITNFIAKSHHVLEKIENNPINFYNAKEFLNSLHQQQNFCNEKVMPKIHEKDQIDFRDKKSKSDKLAEINHKKANLQKLIDALKPMNFITEINDFITTSESLIANADKLNMNNSLEEFDKILSDLKAKMTESMNNQYTNILKVKSMGDLRNIQLFINTLADEPLKTELNNLLNPSFPTMELKDAKTNIESTIKNGIKSFIQNYIASLQELITQYGYTLDNERLNELNNCMSTINGQADLTEKLKQTINILIPELNKFKQQLLDKSLAEIGTDGKLKPKTEAADEIELDDIRDWVKASRDDETEISRASKTGSDLQPLHERLQALREKHGNLTLHQQALEMRIEEYVAARTADNQQTLDTVTTRDSNLFDILNEYAGVTTQQDAKKQEKKIMGKIFWHKKTFERLVGKRARLIGSLDVTTIHFDASSYTTAYDETLARIRKIDEQLFGKKKVESLYASISTRSHHFTLVGGTKLAIPQVLLDMQQMLDEGLAKREGFSK